MRHVFAVEKGSLSIWMATGLAQILASSESIYG